MAGGMEKKMSGSQSREVRIINHSFSLGEYDDSWTKIERYLFLEVYNVIKDFYLSKDQSLIESFSDESIMVRLPIKLLDRSLLKSKNRASQLFDVAERLMTKRIKNVSVDEYGQQGFDFISIFPRIKYDPKEDKDHLHIRIPSEIYEEMVPIEQFCQLDLVLLEEINSGNTIRLYEVFKSHAFKGDFKISFQDLRKELGFYNQNKYKEWKRFNSQVLKPAVEEINSHKEYDIEVDYSKTRGQDLVSFTIIVHHKQQSSPVNVLMLEEGINKETRKLNMIQEKYLSTLIGYCKKVVAISNIPELREWIVSDLISQQSKIKEGERLDFKKAMNEISKQIRNGKYTEPFAHKHLYTAAVFSDQDNAKIKALYNENKLQEIRDAYSDEDLSANRFGYIIDELRDEGINKSA